jgi:RNA polymerase sigma-70 factor (ECF subfamily)
MDASSNAADAAPSDRSNDVSSWREEYEQLRQIARSLMKGEASGHTLQGTALVHEAYLRLTSSGRMAVDRQHFFRRAAQVLRHALVDHARAKRTAKRGGDAERIPLEAVDTGIDRASIDEEAVSAAVDELTRLNARHGEIVTMKFFAGYTNEQVAEALGVSLRTVESDWNKARAWLMVRLKDVAR